MLVVSLKAKRSSSSSRPRAVLDASTGDMPSSMVAGRWNHFGKNFAFMVFAFKSSIGSRFIVLFVSWNILLRRWFVLKTLRFNFQPPLTSTFSIPPTNVCLLLCDRAAFSLKYGTFGLLTLTGDGVRCEATTRSPFAVYTCMQLTAPHHLPFKLRNSNSNFTVCFGE
jgi:hypothetical protein